MPDGIHQRAGFFCRETNRRLSLRDDRFERFSVQSQHDAQGHAFRKRLLDLSVAFMQHGSDTLHIYRPRRLVHYRHETYLAELLFMFPAYRPGPWSRHLQRRLAQCIVFFYAAIPNLAGPLHLESKPFPVRQGYRHIRKHPLASFLIP